MGMLTRWWAVRCCIRLQVLLSYKRSGLYCTHWKAGYGEQTWTVTSVTFVYMAAPEGWQKPSGPGSVSWLDSLPEWAEVLWWREERAASTFTLRELPPPLPSPGMQKWAELCWFCSVTAWQSWSLLSLRCEIKPCFVSSADLTVLLGHNGCRLTSCQVLLLTSWRGKSDGAL